VPENPNIFRTLRPKLRIDPTPRKWSPSARRSPILGGLPDPFPGPRGGAAVAEDGLIVEKSEGIATLTFNRPGAMNALSTGVRTALAQAFEDLQQDPAIGVAILTGAGDRAFSAGLDLKELGGETETPSDVESAVGPVRNPVRAMEGFDRPIIGAINGVAVTGGFEIALACDVLIGSTNARFADTHARVGIMPGWGLTVRLPARIGVTRAREMSFTGNFVDAATALQWGLVNHVVPHDQLVPTALGLAADIAGNDPAAVDLLRRIYDEGEALDADPRWTVEGRTAGRMPGGFDADAMEARRQAVMERGRQQTDTPNS